MARIGTAMLAATFVATVLAGCGQVAEARVDIALRNSHFVPDRITVPADRPISVVLHNEDPIDHEWIVGDAALHARHRNGTEPVHDVRPTEVTVPAGTRRTTVVTFPAGVQWTFICHLPGHERYGMVGTVAVGG